MKKILPTLAVFAVVAVLMGGTMVNAAIFTPGKAPMNYKHAVQAKGMPAEVAEGIHIESTRMEETSRMVKPQRLSIHANSLPELVSHGTAKHAETLEPIEMSYQEVEQNLGLETNQAVLWDSSGRHYAVMTYANGYFIAEVHDTVGGDHPQEGSTWWGIYENGQWTGFYDHPDSDPAIVFGAYNKFPGNPNMRSSYFLWTFQFLGDDHIYRGLGMTLSN